MEGANEHGEGENQPGPSGPRTGRRATSQSNAEKQKQQRDGKKQHLLNTIRTVNQGRNNLLVFIQESFIQKVLGQEKVDSLLEIFRDMHPPILNDEELEVKRGIYEYLEATTSAHAKMDNRVHQELIKAFQKPSGTGVSISEGATDGVGRNVVEITTESSSDSGTLASRQVFPLIATDDGPLVPGDGEGAHQIEGGAVNGRPVPMTVNRVNMELEVFDSGLFDNGHTQLVPSCMNEGGNEGVNAAAVGSEVETSPPCQTGPNPQLSIVIQAMEAAEVPVYETCNPLGNAITSGGSQGGQYDEMMTRTPAEAGAGSPLDFDILDRVRHVSDKQLQYIEAERSNGLYFISENQAYTYVYDTTEYSADAGLQPGVAQLPAFGESGAELRLRDTQRLINPEEAVGIGQNLPTEPESQSDDVPQKRRRTETEKIRSPHMSDLSEGDDEDEQITSDDLSSR